MTSQAIKHFAYPLTDRDISSLRVGEYFTYEIVYYDRTIGYKKGLKVSSQFMIPIGLSCDTIERARIQS